MMGRNNVCLGANDNASGTAAVLTLAQYYSQPENRPELDMVFLWVGGEEANLLGSRYYVENPLFPLENIKYLINLDMIGDTPDMLYHEGGPEADKGLELFMEINKAHGYFPNPHRGELVDNSDHYYFAKAGVPAMYFESKGEFYKYYHSPADNLEHFTSESYNRIFEMVKEFIQRY
jgi:Zn-dependent M28 family amino/carboxypeptidase